jgi:phosphoglycolate phosphatase-like HAD superfamily hydrolase
MPSLSGWRSKRAQSNTLAVLIGDAWLRAAQDRHADFWQVTGDALDFALETIVGKSDLRDQLMSLFLTLDPFPEVPNVLRKLKTAGMRTAILSNGSGHATDATRCPLMTRVVWKRIA